MPPGRGVWPYAPTGRGKIVPIRSRRRRLPFRRSLLGARAGGSLAGQALLRPEDVATVEALERARVAPEPLELGPPEQAVLEVEVVDVGDLQLAAPRRLEPRDVVEDATVVEVETADGEIAPRLLGLLLDPRDPLRVGGVEDRAAVALGVVDALEEDERAAGEVLHRGPDVGVGGVVAEDDRQRPAVGEVLAERQRLGDPA